MSDVVDGRKGDDGVTSDEPFKSRRIPTEVQIRCERARGNERAADPTSHHFHWSSRL
jgi:hypothetical protein